MEGSRGALGKLVDVAESLVKVADVEGVELERCVDFGERDDLPACISRLSSGQTQAYEDQDKRDELHLQSSPFWGSVKRVLIAN